MTPEQAEQKISHLGFEFIRGQITRDEYAAELNQIYKEVYASAPRALPGGMAHLQRIVIEIIPHSEQRYDTAGDYQTDAAGNLTIRVSKLPDWREEVLVALHELVEAILCKHAGIPDAVIDTFDTSWAPREVLVGRGSHGNIYKDIREPGEDPQAPYHYQHMVATGVEVLLAKELGVKWEVYEAHVDNLSSSPWVPPGGSPA